MYFGSGTDSQYHETTVLNVSTIKTTHNNKLAFAKSSVAELNPADIITINGGSTIVGGETCSGCVCLPVQTIVSDGFAVA
ncbi:hypothetical protein [Flavobacterium supellecticarium]|uniref:hypothetical protein n=1 Tax=Flavobacterium supellecticarium TaxID=2565924 RepID=UPI001454C8F2|nr:hypothetical protein [Flavobacterium supellecticarium]